MKLFLYILIIKEGAFVVNIKTSKEFIKSFKINSTSKKLKSP